MSRIPFSYLMYRLFAKSDIKKSFPDEAFKTEWIRCDRKEIHFDFYKCIYNDKKKNTPIQNFAPFL